MSLDLFVEHLTGEPGPANIDLFNRLVSTLHLRRREALLLHFRDGLSYKAVGEQMGGITATRAMQLAERGVRDIRERIAIDTGKIPLLDDEKRGPALRKVIAGTVEDYEVLIAARKRRKAEAEAHALEKHSADPIDTLMLTQPTQRTLVRTGITTVGQLASMSEVDLRSLGRVNMENIISRLGRLGLKLAPSKGSD